MKIEVHIDRLILDGLPLTHRQGPMIQAVVERELTRLLAVEGVSPAATGRGAAPRFELPELTHPARLGQQIARSVHRDISQRHGALAGENRAHGHGEASRS